MFEIIAGFMLRVYLLREAIMNAFANLATKVMVLSALLNEIVSISLNFARKTLNANVPPMVHAACAAQVISAMELSATRFQKSTAAFSLSVMEQPLFVSRSMDVTVDQWPRHKWQSEWPRTVPRVASTGVTSPTKASKV